MQGVANKPWTTCRTCPPFPIRRLFWFLIILVVSLGTPVLADVVVRPPDDPGIPAISSAADCTINRTTSSLTLSAPGTGGIPEAAPDRDGIADMNMPLESAGSTRTLNPGDSIQAAINSAASGSTIVLNPGTYDQHDIQVSKSITIRANTTAGGNRLNTIINAQFLGRIFNVTCPYSLAIDNLTLQNGYSAEGGGAINFPSTGSLLVTSTSFSDCSAAEGGAIVSTSGGTIASTSFFNCSAPEGGAIMAGGTLTITTSTFSDCSATYGGAIMSWGTAAITSSTFSSCSASFGGAINTQSGSILSVISSTFSTCSARYGGSALYLGGTTATLRFSRIYQNTGTVVYRQSGTVDAMNNWWGSNGDPSGSTTGGVSVSPWLVLSMSATPSSIATSQKSTLRTNITRTSAGTDTAGGGIFVPDGIMNTFEVSAGSGSVLPLTTGTAGGIAEATFTPAGTGTSTMTATVDDQTVPADISVALALPAVGVFRDGIWNLDNDGSYSWNTGDTYYAFGPAGATPVFGDWDGDGITEVGTFSSGSWVLDYNGNGVNDGDGVDKVFSFGSPGYQPVVGDWNGDGKDDIGVELDGFWVIDYNGNYLWDGQPTDRFAGFGQENDNPVVGDWNGDGKTKIGSEKDGFWSIDYNGNYLWDGQPADRFAGFGQENDNPVVGDWNGDGKAKIGSEKDGFWATDYNGNYLWDYPLDKFAGFGRAGDKPRVGDYNGDGRSEIVSFTDGFWAVDYNGNYVWDGTVADRFAAFGSAGATPVVGVWG